MAAASANLTLEVSDVRAEACDIVLVELRAPGGALLPPFEPGAHLEIRLPNGLVRHYSLTNDSRERDRYVVGVGRAAASRGGSAYVHQMLRRGATLVCSAPRNNFALDPTAERFCFIAGGIGITPIVSMIRWCVVNGRPWRLVYAARSAQRAAFYETLREHGDAVRFHFDDRDGLLDVGALLASLAPGEHVYCCGPDGLMGAVKAQASPLQAPRVHFEYFSAPSDSGAELRPAGAFRVELRQTGITLDVAPEQSILEAVEAAGLAVPFSCREGTCRTCETSICSGEVEHRDYVLSQDERAAGKSMMICVSRATSELLVLDL